MIKRIPILAVIYAVEAILSRHILNCRFKTVAQWLHIYIYIVNKCLQIFIRVYSVVTILLYSLRFYCLQKCYKTYSTRAQTVCLKYCYNLSTVIVVDKKSHVISVSDMAMFRQVELLCSVYKVNVNEPSFSLLAVFLPKLNDMFRHFTY